MSEQKLKELEKRIERLEKPLWVKFLDWILPEDELDE